MNDIASIFFAIIFLIGFVYTAWVLTKIFLFIIFSLIECIIWGIKKLNLKPFPISQAFYDGERKINNEGKKTKQAENIKTLAYSIHHISCCPQCLISGIESIRRTIGQWMLQKVVNNSYNQRQSRGNSNANSIINPSGKDAFNNGQHSKANVSQEVKPCQPNGNDTNVSANLI
jgi:hypothetical protein